MKNEIDLNNYVVTYAIEPINLYRELNLDGKCLIQATTVEWAATNIATYFARLNLDVHVLDVQEVQHYTKVIESLAGKIN